MNTLLFSLALLAPSADPVAKTPPEGILPAGADGKPLNFDFETGTLKDWTADGEAFKDQPIKGDTVFPRRSDMRSLHQGQFWIGGFEKHGDKPQGTLTSVPFKLTHPWATFLVAGGPNEKETCVEVVDVAKKEVIARVAGDTTETLKRVAVDLTPHVGKEIQVRLVDKSSAGWGHLNFDDFRLHSDKPNVPERVSTKADDYKYNGQKPEDAAKNMTVPPGFSVSLFAGEPDLHQPIAFCFDDRGRLWVVEAYVYPRRHPARGPLLPEAERKNGDKILIFEDTDGDGKFDKKTVFLEGLNLVSGIEYGFGGLWVGAAPYFLFIPIGENDKAGEPKILLDGWGYQDTHETLNSFVWGPDGWLYGCHGVFTHSRVGKPGTPDKDRTPINAGVWRYHPTKHTFEVFCHGTSNPWGLDYNQYGDFFIEACVIPHLWHMVQGGRYERQGGQHFNPYTYDDIKTIAKHRHYVGANPHGGNGRSDSAGGGHAHSGLICYQGGAWPKEYHGKLFMGNIHGHRINVDEIKPKGSSYEGDRNPDFLFSHDKCCIIVAIHTGPDGNVYFCDWSDKQVCHTAQEVWDRTNGRLFKISHKDAKPVKNLDLQKLSDDELVKLQLSDNEWMVRHARRILQERAADKKLDAKVYDQLGGQLKDDKSATNRLRALWALAAVASSSEKAVAEVTLHDVVRNAKVLTDKDPHVRGWALRTFLPFAVNYLGKAESGIPILADESAIFRRDFVSLALHRGRSGSTAVAHFLKNNAVPADADDPLLPLLYWYALEPLVEENPAGVIQAAINSKIDRLVTFAFRRLGAAGTKGAIEAIIANTPLAANAPVMLAALNGIRDSRFVGNESNIPTGWDKLYAALKGSPNAEVKEQAFNVAVLLGDWSARDQLTAVLTDTKADPQRRRNALATLLVVKDKPLPLALQKLVRTDPTLRGAAIRGLAQYDSPLTPTVLVDEYKQFTPAEKRDAVTTLASRAAFARELLAAVEVKTIPSTDIPAEIVRQLRNLNDEAINKQIASVWGVVRDTPADRKKLITEWGRKLNAVPPTPPDLGAGRAVFNKVCAQCHTLYGVGGKVGPEITGANRQDMNYLLENIFDPSAVIPKEYAATKLDLLDGRVVTGIIKEETPATLTVATANETLTIPVKDVDKRTPSELSMMPDDLTKQATETQIRNLFAYLRHTQQVPVLLDAENVKDFFNGKDLTNWDGDKDVWSVENGEIVGKTAKGLKNNTFLKSAFDVTDFKLTVKVKLTPNEGNSGIQFRSVPIDGGEMRGAQADIGKGWWGKLYEESARGLLVKEGGEKHVKENDWNEYTVEAWEGNVRLSINGNVCCDYRNDDKLARRGVIAFQVHSGGPMEVRFKDLKLEVIPKK